MKRARKKGGLDIRDLPSGSQLPPDGLENVEALANFLWQRATGTPPTMVSCKLPEWLGQLEDLLRWTHTLAIAFYVLALEIKPNESNIDHLVEKNRRVWMEFNTTIRDVCNESTVAAENDELAAWYIVIWSTHAYHMWCRFIKRKWRYDLDDDHFLPDAPLVRDGSTKQDGRFTADLDAAFWLRGLACGAASAAWNATQGGLSPNDAVINTVRMMVEPIAGSIAAGAMGVPERCRRERRDDPGNLFGTTLLAGWVGSRLNLQINRRLMNSLLRQRNPKQSIRSTLAQQLPGATFSAVREIVDGTAGSQTLINRVAEIITANEPPPHHAKNLEENITAINGTEINTSDSDAAELLDALGQLDLNDWPEMSVLSPREREVRALAGAGFPLARIAECLGVSLGAVKQTYARAKKKRRQLACHPADAYPDRRI